jgi:murein DD-endopeptidase MepM/ murein hydrolase activator NlpD
MRNLFKLVLVICSCLTFFQSTVTKANDFICPLEKCDNISSYFSNKHNGIDFYSPVGSVIKSPATGVVVRIGSTPYAGNFIVLKHKDGYETRYLHLNDILVKINETVLKGQTIAKTGKSGLVTGPILHWEVNRDGKAVNPIIYIKMDRHE